MPPKHLNKPSLFLPCAVAIIFWLAAAGCSRVTAPKNVLLITVDTLRADHLRCYGHAGIDTPNFDRLARDGVRFERAFCQAPLTLPSHASILTGTYPMVNHVRQQTDVLNRTTKTLAELLKERGFATGAFLGSVVLDSRYGLNRGFDSYYDRFQASAGAQEASQSSGRLPNLERSAGEVAKAALAWISSQSGRPFFAWVHFYDPHDPYRPPEPFSARYKSAPYDGEIAYVDSVLGTLLDSLKAEGLYDGTLIVLLSDHGESLGEHGESFHGLLVYDSTLRVPLLIKLQKGVGPGGKVIERPVSGVDLVPTILEFLRIPAPEHLAGSSLTPLIVGPDRGSERDTYSESFYPRFGFGWSELRSLRSGKYKYIESPHPELFDTDADRGELHNLIGNTPQVANQLRAKLAALERTHSGSQGASGADAQAIANLKSLGYVGSSASAAVLNGKNLPDPKEKIQGYEALQKATLASNQGDTAGALRWLNACLKLDPELMNAWVLQGEVLRQAGQAEKALSSFEHAVKLDSQNAVALYQLALAQAGAGHSREAENAFKRVLQLDSSFADAHTGLGLVYQASGRIAEAVQQYQSALRMNPHDADAINNLAAVYLGMEKPAAAIELLKRLLADRPQNFQALINLGSAYFEQKKYDQALDQFQTAARINPNYAPLEANIGMVYLAENRVTEARQHFRRALQLDPASRDARHYLGVIGAN